MLGLERRPVEPRARAMFVQARAEAFGVLATEVGGLVPGLTDAQVDQLVTYAIAGADGLFITKEISGDSVDLGALFEIHARALDPTAVDMAAKHT